MDLAVLTISFRLYRALGFFAPEPRLKKTAPEPHFKKLRQNVNSKSCARTLEFLSWFGGPPKKLRQNLISKKLRQNVRIGPPNQFKNSRVLAQLFEFAFWRTFLEIRFWRSFLEGPQTNSKIPGFWRSFLSWQGGPKDNLKIPGFWRSFLSWCSGAVFFEMTFWRSFF